MSEIPTRLAEMFSDVWAVVGDLYVFVVLGAIAFGVGVVLYEVRRFKDTK